MTAEDEARQYIKELHGVDNPTNDLIRFYVVIDEVRADIIKRKIAELESQQIAG